jgi:hypothetical protein
MSSARSLGLGSNYKGEQGSRPSWLLPGEGVGLPGRWSKVDLLKPIDRDEQGQPHDIDEMPVLGYTFKGKMTIGCEMPLIERSKMTLREG